MRILGLTILMLLVGLHGYSQNLKGVQAYNFQYMELLNNYNKFIQKGVPEDALNRAMTFFSQYYGKKLNIVMGEKTDLASFKNGRYMVIIDYSKSSVEKRFYILDLGSGRVEQHYVSHGMKSGCSGKPAIPCRFSNTPDSEQTSLGFFLTAATYNGKYGRSLRLHGLQPSNSQAYNRAIVMHGAPYVSEAMIQKYKFLGRSQGCPALELKVAKKWLPLLEGGTLVYAYHKDLVEQVFKDPTYQSILDPSPTDQDPPPTPEELEVVTDFNLMPDFFN